MCECPGPSGEPKLTKTAGKFGGASKLPPKVVTGAVFHKGNDLVTCGDLGHVYIWKGDEVKTVVKNVHTVTCARSIV